MKKCPKCGNGCRPAEAECLQCGCDLIYYVKKLTKEKKAAADERVQRVRFTARLIRLVEEMSMDQLSELIEQAEKICGVNKRVHERIPCQLTADCVIDNFARQKFIRDISLGGVFLESPEKLPQGLSIPMTLSMAHHYKPFKIMGEIARNTPRGIGVRFKTTSQVQEEMIKGIVAQVEKYARSSDQI